MNFAYADPPYLGQGKKYPEHVDAKIWDKPETHGLLVERLVREYPDGWALSLSSPSLAIILPFCPPKVRIGAWCKSFCIFKKGVRPCYAWEPVIFFGGRNPPEYPHKPPVKGGKQNTPKDFLVCPITLRKGLTGAKPPEFCGWVLDLLGFLPGDAVEDLFPGTGSMSVEVSRRSPRIKYIRRKV